MKRILLSFFAFLISISIVASNNTYGKQERKSPSSFNNKNPISKEKTPPKTHSLEFIKVNIKDKIINEDSIYADILNRSPTPDLTELRHINAHENTHFINAFLRNSNPIAGKKVNGFYLLEGRGIVIEEPPVLKNDLIPFLPLNVKGWRHETYISGQQQWNDHPMYIMDEWIAYINGDMCKLEDIENKRNQGIAPHDASGSFEFCIYSIALAMAVEKKCPDYWKNNQQFKSFIKFNLERSEKVFRKIYKNETYMQDNIHNIYTNLQTSDSTKAMRAFINENFDGIFLEKKQN